MSTTQEELIQLYNEVFYPDGAIKLCGRDKCRALMIACSDISEGEKFGDIKTGIMDSKKIKDFVDQILVDEHMQSLQ